VIKFSIYLSCLFISSIALGQNDSLQNSGKRNSIMVSWESLSLQVGMPSETGGGVSYSRDFFTKEKHNFAFQTTANFIYDPNIRIIYFFGLGALYRYEVSERSSLGLNIAGNYVHTHLSYERFEYNSKGEIVSRGSDLHSFAPSIGMNYSYDVFKLKSATFGVLLGTRLIGLDNGRYTNFFEAGKLNISFGIFYKF
jgi:hypothetical protein